MGRYVLQTALCILVFVPVAPGQGQKPTPPPQPPPTQPPPTQPPSTQPPPQPTTGTRKSSIPDTPAGPESELHVFISGRLAMADGLPPQEMVPVSLDCQSQPNQLITSDLRGEFRIPLKLPNTATSVPEIIRLTSTCAVVVTVPGFETIRKPLHGLDISRGADVGVLVLRPVSGLAGTLISLNSLKAPESARKELLRAREDLQKEKWDSAKDRLEKAVRIYPGYATAWYELGKVQAREGAADSAAASYRRASEADPNYVSPAIELALMAAVGRRWEEAEQRSEAILEIAPEGLPGIYLVRSIACFNQKKMDEAEESARAGLRQTRAGQFPKLADILGNILLMKGDNTGASEAFRQYLELAPNSPEAPRVRQQLEALTTK